MNIQEAIDIVRHPEGHTVQVKEEARLMLADEVIKLQGLLTSSRSSVKADLTAWEQLVARKERAGSLNTCDSGEAQRIFRLLEDIDSALTATEPSTIDPRFPEAVYGNDLKADLAALLPPEPMYKLGLRITLQAGLLQMSRELTLTQLRQARLDEDLVVENVKEMFHVLKEN